MKIININSIYYPENLKKIDNPPLSLYVEGNIDLLKSKSIAIIGSRNASDNGKKIAQKFASELSDIGLTIISGLAVGIDTIAHISSLNKKGKTIAVLGSGFNKIFPEENINLYNQIIENGGLIISEYPPNIEAESNNFRTRNRIISGISLGVLVIEAKYRSGTSITANFAKKQGRPIFTIPHELGNPNGIGTNRLLKNGATLVTDTMDILKNLKLKNYIKSYIKLESHNSNIINCTTINKESESTKSKPTVFKDAKYNDIYTFIQKNSIKSKIISLNDIIQNFKYPTNEVSSTLFMLEINGYIKKVSGGYISCI